MKKQEKVGNKNKKQGSRAVKSCVEIPALEGAAPLSCRASHSSRREYLAHGDTFLCQHPAKVAPRTDYPTRAGHGRRRSLPALPCQGEGCLPPPQGARAAAAAPVLLGSFGGVPSYPGAGSWGKMRVNSSFLLYAGGFFVMGHGDFGPCKFWAVSDAELPLPLAGSVMLLSLHCHLCQPLFLWEDAEA